MQTCRTRAALSLRAIALAAGLWAAAPAAAQERVDAPEPYTGVAERLTPFIEAEVKAKGLPALSIALVDDQRVVWARGFGRARPKSGERATAQTVYRVGSVSKLFTDLAVMRLVEQGKLDLDAPVTRYLPEFKPENPFEKPITLRQLMAHRSGLVREPPVGNYFDPDNPTLAETIESLNRTKLVYAPESRIKYSNAGIAAVGLTLEKTQGEPFPAYLKRTLLEPLGMATSDFVPSAAVKPGLADAVMWTYHGRTFPAPTFELGMAPAGSLYTTVLDLSKFLYMLFAGGKVGDRRIVEEKTLREMMTPQFADPDEKEGFGIGFYLSELDGKKRVGHGGAIYGFATELAALPEEKLGVVVVASKDVANAVTRRIADAALGQMLAAREGKEPPAIERTEPLTPEAARKWAGRYQHEDRFFDLYERGGHLWMIRDAGGYRTELRAAGGDLVVDDVVSHGARLTPAGDGLRFDGKVYERVEVPLPPEAPERWTGLIGEYGWDHNTLTVLEKDGKLHALIEWVFLYPLSEESDNVFAFPDYGLYHGEKLVFRREGRGKASAVEAASVVFERRRLDGEDGRTFTIRPQRPVPELRAAALKAEPPTEKGFFREPELVDLATLDPALKFDVRYATDDNFLRTPVYTSAKAFLQKPAAEAMLRAHRKLGERGYGLLVHDGYRPWYVTKIFYDATPAPLRNFVADPSKGSRHNRGCAVDLTLYDRATGEPVAMVSGYDEFSDRSYPDYIGGTSRQRWLRDLLRRAMEDEGFTVYSAEWWHFDHKDWRKYPILNQTFEQLAPRESAGARRPPLAQHSYDE